MQKKYILGVDGGGTKTHCVLYNLENDTVSFMEWSATNHERLKRGYDDLKDTLQKMLSELQVRNSITLSDIYASCFTLSGVDFPFQETLISEILCDLGVKNFILKNDTFAGIKACCEYGYGIAAVNGTGCCVAGIDEKGNTIQIGGLGLISNDKGGSRNMVEIALQKVYNMQFKHGEETLLSEYLSKSLHTNEESVIEKGTFALMQDNLNSIRYMSVAVFEAANSNDKIALEILKDIGAEYAKCIEAVYDNLNFTSDEIKVALIGTQFVKGENPSVVDEIKRKLGESSINFDIEVSNIKPVTGSVVWAAEMAGVDDSQRNIIKKKVGET